jgi:hypothetical protein
VLVDPFCILEPEQVSMDEMLPEDILFVSPRRPDFFDVKPFAKKKNMFVGKTCRFCSLPVVVRM